MTSKSLKASVTLASVQVEDAIVFLTDRYLKATKTTCRTVQTPTDYCWADLCQPLIEGWISAQKVSYAKGKITLIFRSGHLSDEADMIIYAPTRGDRFLYTKSRSQPGNSDQLALDLDASPEAIADRNEVGATNWPNNVFKEIITRQAEFEEKLKRVLEIQAAQTAQITSIEDSNPVNASLGSEQSSIDGAALDAFAKTFKRQTIHQIRETLIAALQPIQNDIAELREQMAELGDRLEDLEDLSLEDELPVPQSLQEWKERIDQMWGTVGDYERYNASYRDANAETPLCETPDWVALCELEWARELCAPLKALHSLIHRSDGIGYEGADILQQFGQHIDAKTGDCYYIYRYSGYTALEAFQQIVNSPDHSWLPELTRLWKYLGSSDHPLFQLFGWESEAIAALKAIATQHQGRQQSGYSWDYRQPRQAQSQYGILKEYRAVLNLGPFTPITIESVKRAYRQAMKTAHPDSGGSTESAQRVNEAYEAIMRHYFPEAT
ncbi:MAG: hypothetical protein AAFR31_03510 [Cyanobacteria bacterium J06627_8]